MVASNEAEDIASDDEPKAQISYDAIHLLWMRTYVFLTYSCNLILGIKFVPAST